MKLGMLVRIPDGRLARVWAAKKLRPPPPGPYRMVRLCGPGAPILGPYRTDELREVYEPTLKLGALATLRLYTWRLNCLYDGVVDISEHEEDC